MPTMVDMRLPKPKKRPRMAEVAMDTYPKYPYGLELRLSEKELKKLKKDVGDFQVGQPKMIVATVKVTSVSKSEAERGENSQNVGLQITKMQFMKK